MSEIVPADREPWHLDRKVPLALMVALVAQTLGLGWWAASLSGEVREHGRRIIQLEASDSRQATEAARVAEALARLDERMLAQTQILRRIEETLQRQGR